MKKLNEDGIGSNYYTIDPGPIDFFHDERVEVEIFPSTWGKYSVIVTAPDINYSSGQREYHTEDEATTFARNEYTQLITKLDNSQKIEESLLMKVLERLERCFNS
jgi:restriction endonuclease